MNVTYNETATLRSQMGGHPPIVLEPIEREREIWSMTTETNTVIFRQMASTLRNRDYKDPQIVAMKSMWYED